MKKTTKKIKGRQVIVWELDKWYEKTMYIVGIIYAILIGLEFIAGFMAGYMGVY